MLIFAIREFNPFVASITKHFILILKYNNIITMKVTNYAAAD